jgi:phosphoserine aminotransferase
METHRICNFNPGPAALPQPVLEEVRDSFLNFQGTGISIAETSHRAKEFEAVLNDAVARTRRILGLDAAYHVLFLQGGASLQFAMVPMNLLRDGETADYVNTGTWSSKAIQEARVLGKTVQVVASAEDRDFSYIPTGIRFNPDAVYAHLTSNNTIKGTQWAAFPDTAGVPLVADMSSDFLSRRFDPRPFGLIYAGAQKNIGPAGVTLVIIRQDLLSRVPQTLPSMLKYTTFAAKNSLYNTPPCLAIYLVQLVLKWLEETIGGIDPMERLNRRKASLLYRIIDEGGFYRGTAQADSRSAMNITFRLPSEALEKAFLDEAQQNGFVGLKGHRSVGGCRASLYNAVTLEAVEALDAFMNDFARRNG